MMTQELPSESVLTIGQLSQLTGIGQHTLRVWERRYDALKVIRLPSGHRRYPQEEVKRLRAISSVLDKGYRTGRVVNRSMEELEQLLKTGAEEPVDKNDAGKLVRAIDIPLVLEWISAARHFDENFLTSQYYREWNLRGPLTFLSELAIPFLQLVGEKWETGEVTVSQEHFASEGLYDFFGKQWRLLNEENSGRPYVLTTLPEEKHRMGIQMCALVTALTGKRVVFLGQDTPLADTLLAVEKTDAQGLAIGVSISYPLKVARSHLQDLRKKLPQKTPLILGGAKVRELYPANLPEKVMMFSNFEDYYLWLNGHRSLTTK